MKSKKYVYDYTKTDWVTFYFVIIKLAILLNILKVDINTKWYVLFIIGVVVNFVCSISRFLIDPSYKNFVKNELINNYHLEEKHLMRTVFTSIFVISLISWLGILNDLWKFFISYLDSKTLTDKSKK